MKNALLLITAMLLLAACDKKYCWDCEVNTTTLGTSPAGDSVLVKEGSWDQYCDKTEREIDALQKEKTGRTITQDGNYTVDKTTTYHCQKAD